jgi:hypothetical protein
MNRKQFNRRGVNCLPNDFKAKYKFVTDDQLRHSVQEKRKVKRFIPVFQSVNSKTWNEKKFPEQSLK